MSRPSSAISRWNSRQQKPKVVRYKTCLVTYLDILGFRRLLQEKTAAEISRVLRIVKQAARHDRETETEFERLYENFSDLSLRTVTVSSPEFVLLHPSLLSYELEGIAKIQIELIRKHGILMRGGIAIGKLVKSWGLVYGQGMVNAYELETKAKYPRVAIHRDLIQIIETLREQKRFEFTFSQRTVIDEHGAYVDYLRYSQLHFDHDKFLDFIATHKDVIELGLAQYASEPRIKSKFNWLRHYHNRTLRLLGVNQLDNTLLIAPPQRSKH